jgi:energy-coupling factor transporter ATP-binding protein EcfA2
MIHFHGARWWKVDVHTHTPASTDFGKGTADQQRIRDTTTPAEWLRAYMQAGVDAVVVTDHNTGAWIDRLKAELSTLRSANDASFRELALFPGVEITAHGGAHILAVLPLEAATANVEQLLGAVGYRGVPGASDVAADSSPIQVVERIVAAGGVPILAHVDAPANSALAAPGNSLGPLLHSSGLFAVEVRNVPTWTVPELYEQQHLSWPRLLGSDAHHLQGVAGQRFPGSHFTWVKMEQPSLDGLRLALLDGEDTSIRRSDTTSGDLNHVGHTYIDHLEIREARYAGRGAPLAIELSPGLTTIIGGRGSGKSTVIELLRTALRRDSDADVPEVLRPERDRFRAIPSTRADVGALRSDTQVHAFIQKDHHEYCVHWPGKADAPAIEVKRNDDWLAEPGEIRHRFPARIFSQGEIFALARDSRALLQMISEAPEVQLAGWRARWQVEESRFLSLRAKLRDLVKQVGERPTVEGSLADITRKLALFEQAEHAQVLKDYQRAQSQRKTIDDWTKQLDEAVTTLQATADHLAPADYDFDVQLFVSENAGETTIRTMLASSGVGLQALADRAGTLAQEAREHKAAWLRGVAESSWTHQSDDVTDRYNALVANLAARGVPDVGQYGVLVKQRNELDERLRNIDGLAATVAGVRADVEISLSVLSALRAELSTKRAQFLETLLRDNRHVRMVIEPYGADARGAESGFRERVARGDGKLTDEILSADGARGCLADLYRDLPELPEHRSAELAKRIAVLKLQLETQALDPNAKGWFARHLRGQPPEVIDRLYLWFPPDDLVVTYSQRGDGRHFRSLEQGSRGQKAAAVLAFLLSYGDEPIVLDQPEDDLDNELIYDLIVAQLRENKRRRQVIVVTHNPNIVVNGDAEQIIIMTMVAGQCRTKVVGTLQSPAIRREVCLVMEGGREALEKRYRRILGVTDV